MEQSSNMMRRFNHLFNETGAVYHEVSARLGVADSVMQILYTVCDYGSGYRCPLRTIRTQTGMSKQTINSALRRLETEGAVRLAPAGGKNKDVCLTPQGIELAERTASRIIKAENAIFDSWQREDVETYLALTEKYLIDLRREAQTISKEYKKDV